MSDNAPQIQEELWTTNVCDGAKAERERCREARPRHSPRRIVGAELADERRRRVRDGPVEVHRVALPVLRDSSEEELLTWYLKLLFS